LFREFSIVAPAGDEPSGDISGNFSPVWINRIERLDVTSDNLRVFFSTFNIEKASLVPIEFATLDLARDASAGSILAIVPSENLFPSFEGNNKWMQEFGKGHVVLSDSWGGTSASITDFFDSFLPIIDEPPQAVFTKASTRISAFGISRVPKLTPTTGQAEALRGSRSTNIVSSHPSSTNRYVVEADQGLGDQIDFATHTSLPEDKRNNPDIERFGFTGGLVHKSVKLVVNASGTDHDYEDDILPRLRILLGRDPLFLDEWFDGTRFKKYDGNVWIG